MYLVFKTLLTNCFCLSARPFSVWFSTVIEVIVMSVHFSMNIMTHAASKMVKIKESRKRPGVVQRVPGVLGSQIS